MWGGVAPRGKFTWTVSKEDAHLSDWWHVFNLEVKSELEPLGYGYNQATRRIKKVLVHNVNQMLRPGLLIDDQGKMSGKFALEPHRFSDPAWLDQYQVQVGKVLLPLHVCQYPISSLPS
jgi:hypothetical protein